MAPPRLPPYWFLLNGGFGLAGSSKNWRASRRPLRAELECRPVHRVRRRIALIALIAPPAAAELRAIGIGQRLEFFDRFDAERRAEHARAGGTVPEVRDVGVVEQERLTLGPSAPATE